MAQIRVGLACGHTQRIDKPGRPTPRRCQVCGQMQRIVTVYVAGEPVPFAEWRGPVRQNEAPARKAPARLEPIVVPHHQLAATIAKLRRQGWPDDLIDKYVTTPYEPPNDTGYEPAYIDPVLRGPARATGQTAAAVRRGRTIRRADYHDREGTA